MSYKVARLALERYEREVVHLLDLVILDVGGDEVLAQTIVFTSMSPRWRLSPSDLLRRGLLAEAYEATRANFQVVRKADPEHVARAARTMNAQARSTPRAR